MSDPIDSPAADLSRLMPDIDQHGRMLQLDSALPHLALIPERLALREAVGLPFDMQLDALSTHAHLDVGALLGEQLTVRLLQPDGTYRPWHGYVFEVASLGSDGGLARYRVVMRPWIAFMALRRDSFVYQDRSVLDILRDVAADYHGANLRIDASDVPPVRSLCCQYRETDLEFVQRLLAAEGLSWHVEHLDAEAAVRADAAGHARHVVVVTDAASQRRDLGAVRFAAQHPTANLDGQKDAITAFMTQRTVAANAVALGSWDYKRLAGVDAHAASGLALGDIPVLEVYDGSGAYRWADPDAAERRAALALAALELDVKRFEGQGSARHLQAGARISLVDHPLYGAAGLPGSIGSDGVATTVATIGAAFAPPPSHLRTDNAFTVLAVEHHATNNLGSQIARLLESSDLERGTYKNHFHAVPAAAAIVPRWLPKPTAHGLQTAIVVGFDGEPLTTDRDLRVKVQFAWQRGRSPLVGGLAHDGTSPDAQGNAPGNERSGTWVRVAHPSAGANWGASFVPRVGTEVAVGFVEGDIDRPVVLGQLYNGVDAPPFAAGVDSGVNHPGVISGVHTHQLAASGQGSAGWTQWVLDDATGQLRTRLVSSASRAGLSLGHLIEQPAGSAQRGSWRGSGFEAATEGWASIRAAQGLMISATTRRGSHGSAQSGQLDANEALAQMRGANQLGQALSEAAKAQGAHELATHRAEQAWSKAIRAIDPTQDGKLSDTVNGQIAKHLDDRRAPTTPVESLATPHILLDTPAGSAWATPAGIHAIAGQDTSLVAQADLHIAAAHTHAAISGRTTSIYAHQGGMQAKAAAGPVSIRAHTDQLQLWADRDVTITSVDAEIRVEAKTRIELTAADSSIALDGGDVTFTTPGTFEARHSAHRFLDGTSNPASLRPLPQGALGMTMAADRPRTLERFEGSVDE